MSRGSQALRRLAGAISIALVLVACSSGGGASAGGGASSTTPSPKASPSAGASCQSQGGLTGTVSDHGTEQVGGTQVELQAADTFFQPTCVVVSGGRLAVTVQNAGSALHDFSVTSLGIDEDVQPGKTITVHVRFDGSTPLPFFCKYHVGAGMQGAFLPAGG